VALLAARRGESAAAPARRVAATSRLAPRLAACALAYVVFYFAFGAVAYPFVAEFYAGRALPHAGAIAALQVVRGLAFAAICLAWLREPWPRRGEAVLWTGVALSVLGGVAPLLLPNPYMPAAVRAVHLWEVGLSNLAFGCLAGWLLSRRRRAVAERIAPAAGTA
jgi:hypothetical protein